MKYLFWDPIAKLWELCVLERRLEYTRLVHNDCENCDLMCLDLGMLQVMLRILIQV